MPYVKDFIPIILLLSVIGFLYGYLIPNAYKSMETKVEEYRDDDYRCTYGRYNTGVSHARTRCYVCTKESDSVSISIGGRVKAQNACVVEISK